MIGVDWQEFLGDAFLLIVYCGGFALAIVICMGFVGLCVLIIKKLRAVWLGLRRIIRLWWDSATGPCVHGFTVDEIMWDTGSDYARCCICGEEVRIIHPGDREVRRGKG